MCEYTEMADIDQYMISEFEDAVKAFIENSESPEVAIIKRSTPTPPTACLICGDPTQCCHYHVPSCPACKAFFRRCIISGKTFFCKKNGKCDVKAKDRCRKCRFDQCILVGMNPIGIKLPDEIDLAVVIERIESRKRVLMQNLGIVDTASQPSSSTAKSSSVESMPVIPVKMSRIRMPKPMEYRDVDFLLFLELKVRKLRKFSFNPDYLFKLSLTEIIQKESELGNVDRYDCDVTSSPVPDDSNQHSVGKIDSKNVMRVLRHWSALDLLLTIDMAKILPVYAKLDHTDKEAFIRNTYGIVTLFTRSYYSYERHSDAVIYPDGFMPISLFLKSSRSISKLESEVMVRCIQPVKRIDLTKEEYVLLKAILFCNPTCENMSDAGRELLKKESERYSKTLVRYMQSIHGDEKGASRYAQVIAVVEAMLYFAMRTREYQLIRQLQRVEDARRRGEKFKPTSIVDESC